MRTDLINLTEIPDSNELNRVLGESIYEYYKAICNNIVTLLTPDIERWALGGRRGNYYHGYVVEKKSYHNRFVSYF